MALGIDLSIEAERALVFGVLALALGLFVYGRWRYDIVAVIALLILTLTEVIEAEEAFSGFGHPAVVTVGAVLIISRGLTNSGAVDFLASRASLLGDRPLLHLVGLTALVIVLSGFINNIGALALLMPVAIRMARSGDYSPSFLLMPLAFGSLLGGMTTLIGTPPNVIVATVSEANGQASFSMFDFAPVGGGIALAGGAFITLAGWRLVPQRAPAGGTEEAFETEGYIAEVGVQESSKAAGMTIYQFERALESPVIVAGLVRGEHRVLVPSAYEVLHPGDVLLVEADAGSLEELVTALDLELQGRGSEAVEQLSSDEVQLMEAVVLPHSMLEGRSAFSLNLRSRFGLNLLAVSRRGARIRERLGSIRMAAGDIVLLQGTRETLLETVAMLGCAPIASRQWDVERRPQLLLALGLFGTAIILTALGVFPVQIALATAALVMIMAGVLNLRDAYEAVDWPILVLLGAMIPVGGALETTGGADLIVDRLFSAGQDLPPVASIAVILVVTMFLSDLVNNAAAAVLMAPIAIKLAAALDAASEPYLMAVAVGASCAFLTPIGHQSNTLVMGPGGYRFGDYWRLGLPLQAVIVAVGVPLILLVWPP